MKWRLSGLRRVEVRAEVHARTLAEAVQKASRADFEGWEVTSADLYSVTDVCDAAELDRSNAEWEAERLKQEALRDRLAAEEGPDVCRVCRL